MKERELVQLKAESTLKLYISTAIYSCVYLRLLSTAVFVQLCLIWSDFIKRPN